MGRTDESFILVLTLVDICRVLRYSRCDGSIMEAQNRIKPPVVTWHGFWKSRFCRVQLLVNLSSGDDSGSIGTKYRPADHYSS